MTENQEKSNTFKEMEKAKVPVQAANSQSSNNELSLDDFSDVAVGDKVKYTRPNLDNKEDVISKFQVFMPDINKDEPKQSRDGKTEYWTVSMILTYKSINEDGVQNKEYISGAKVFRQQDGSASEPNFWYDRARTQAAYLWNKVAEAKQIKPEELSPKLFIAFLNNEPKVLLESKEYDNYTKDKNAPAFVYKNMPKEFK